MMPTSSQSDPERAFWIAFCAALVALSRALRRWKLGDG